MEDLAFDRAETEGLMLKVAGVAADQKPMANLQSKVEGWIVGLQSVLSLLKKRPDPNEFLLKLGAGPRSVERYLADEVLSRQCSCLRDSLARASILDRFNGPLWEAVCGSALCDHLESSDRDLRGASDPIQLQVQKGLFLLSMDDEGVWYRYHPMFRKLLREHLEAGSDRDTILMLHERASAWFESAGLIQESIEYARLAEDETRSAEIVERNRAIAMNSGDGQELRSWLGQLSGSLRSSRFGLLMAEAATAFEQFEIVTLSSLLESVDELDEVPAVSAEQTFFRGAVTFYGGDTRGSMRFFDEVLEMTPRAESWLRIHSHFYRGVGFQMDGRGGEALREIGVAIDHEVGGQDSTSAGLHWSMMFLQILSGDLLRIGPDSEQLVEAAGPGFRSGFDYLFGSCALRRFDLVAAQEHLSRVQSPHSWMGIDGQAALALSYETNGQSREADECLHRAREAAMWSGRRSNVFPLESAAARIALIRGDLEAARRWQRLDPRELNLALTCIATEVPAITACRVLGASTDEIDLRNAADMLDVLSKDFGAVHFVCQQREIAPLKAVVLSRLGEEDQALDLLAHSIGLAVPEGWIRPFVELGEPMAELLDRLPAPVANQSFVDRIQSILRGDMREIDSATVASLHSERRGDPETLTNREFDVLEHLAARLRDKEIAGRLMISPATVKTHLKSLYRKLGCSSRQEAVAMAVAKNILPPSAFGAPTPPPA